MLAPAPRMSLIGIMRGAARAEQQALACLVLEKGAGAALYLEMTLSARVEPGGAHRYPDRRLRHRRSV